MKSLLAFFVCCSFVTTSVSLDLSAEKKVYRFRDASIGGDLVEVIPGLALTRAEFRSAGENAEARRFYRDFKTDYEFILKGEADQEYQRDFLGHRHRQRGRNFVTEVYQRWPNGVIPYAIGK